jgi:hypothetical protein
MISVLITNYNTWDLCIKSIRSISEENLKFISEIIIVDDASDQVAPIELVNHQLVRIVKNNINLGYASSVNKAFEFANESICLLLDSDAYILSGLEHIEKQFDNNANLGILAPLLVDIDGNSTGRAEPEVHFWGLLLGQQLDAKIGKYIYKPSSRWSIFSCGMAVKKEAFFDVNGFDTSFDFLDADHDFSMKINRTCWKIKFEDRCRIYHIGNGSPQTTSKRVIRFYRNRIKLLKKYNKIKSVTSFKQLLLIRINVEYWILHLLKILRINTMDLNDKILGRKNIIKFLKDNG